MLINKKKSKVMILTTARNFDVMLDLTLPGRGVGESLEVVASFILLGVVLQIDLKWNDNTNNICQKGYQRLWMIRRLKKT